MITKERLEELIKKDATIYAVIQGGVEPIDLKFRKNYYSYEDYAHFIYWVDVFEQDVEIDNEMCYETKKQAKWVLKYHATRTEELDLPMWEENKKIGTIKFIGKDKSIYVFYYDDLFDLKLKVYDKTLCRMLFCRKPTKENYIKACDLCLKLFEGEEDGD